MQTNKWGPCAWEYLHTLTFNYPENPTDDNKKYYYELFDNLKFTLPCKYCRESYSIFFKYININNYLNDRMGITYWLYTIHNIVNYKLNKKKVDFIDVVHFYEKRRANQTNKSCKKICICNEIVCCCQKQQQQHQKKCNCNCNCKGDCKCKSDCKCNYKNDCNCKGDCKCKSDCKCNYNCDCNNCNCKSDYNCNCDQCNKNFDFVFLTKLKYDKITNDYIKQLIECDELKK
jgi:hypothetical protein